MKHAHVDGLDLAKLLHQTADVLLLRFLIQLTEPQGRAAHCAHTHTRTS